VAFDLRVKNDPTPALSCLQGREYTEAALKLCLLCSSPCLQGGGWEGVAFDLRAKSDPTQPSSLCEQGREHRKTEGRLAAAFWSIT
jgi:hypothetical protein